MPESNLIKYYCRWAPDYERIYYRDNPERRQEIDDEVVRLKKLAAGKTVLDIPCGTGYWLEFMSQTAHEITAADISAEMLREARLKKAACPVMFVQAGLESIPFEDHSFDLIALGFWLSHQPKQSYEKLFDELNRVLRPGGTIWIIDNNPPAEGNMRRLAGHDAAGNQLIKRKVPDGEEFQIIKNYFSEEDLRRVLEPFYRIERLTHKPYYWSVELRVR
ncbi:MAG TPA: class I SAM-dependent methyltransferase [candidate division Zixibacteria bacterium]|nr:class I SAM-dependent methyltransferase [candidate division Zixibacteria bacterium]